MNKKKWVSLSLMAALGLTGLTIAGCGDDSASGKPADTPKEVTLKLTTWNPVSQKVLNMFHEKYPHITVEHDKVFDQYREIIRTRLVSKADMDMIWLFPNQLEEFSKQDALMDITGSSWLGDYMEAAVNVGTVNGKTYGAPYNYYAVVVLYNQDVFDKLSLTVPKNWDELMAVSAKIKDSGMAPFVFGGKDSWITQFIASAQYGAIEQKSPGIFDKIRKGEKKWTGPEFTGFFDQFKTLVDNGYALDNAIGLGMDQVAQVFKEGKAAMWPMGSWALDNFPADFKNFKLGAFVVPVNKPGDPLVVNLISDNVLVGVKWSKHQDEVKKFMEFIADPKIAQIWSEETKTAVTVKGGSSPNYHPVAPSLTPQIDNNPTQIFPILSPSFEPAFFPLLQQILLKQGVDEAKMLQVLQDAQNTDLKK